MTKDSEPYDIAIIGAGINGAGIARVVPGARFEVLPGARHWAVWERAEQVAHRVLEFADSL